MSRKHPLPERERRKNSRSDVQVWAVEKDNNSTSFHLLTNLSIEGFFIEKKLPLPVGSIIDFELELDGEKLPLRGKIVNNYENPVTKNSGAGVHFVDMDEKVKTKIEEYLKSLDKTNPESR
jgi:Tfp pilus assembly protein PilZ